MLVVTDMSSQLADLATPPPAVTPHGHGLLFLLEP